ncbi:CAMK family protein kinase [Tritrichomonas foetus]|uniref:CAMK family protein kinase n=1 Tax=Tritrichomonas foetus TaxID=1144522 RepID=A0A1J4JQZ5_9EUKA|nr:CAMK family protein kinase [Tritrichomonas foetus]|eukprot:OHT01451.1 CAMK family protein kinase [Tritrichomonas foetus]
MNLPSIGNYDLIKEIGNGATSTVFYAIHRPTGVPVAVKAINLPTERPLAEKETAILKKLSHPCICEFYEVIYSDEKAYLAMELVDQAKDLLKYVNLRGKVGESEARTILSQLMCVIQYLHSNKIVHRDIKLENILLAESGKNNFIIKIIDFGMSHQCSNENNAMSTHCGSLGMFFLYNNSNICFAK